MSKRLKPSCFKCGRRVYHKTGTYYYGRLWHVWCVSLDRARRFATCVRGKRSE